MGRKGGILKMNAEYVSEGYSLMMEYMKENRIKTRHRNFVRRLNNFYNKYEGVDLEGVDELRYLELEKYFFENIAPPQNNNEQALVEVLKILSSNKIKE